MPERIELQGEFAPESKEFQQVAHELGIQLKYASPHDKRTNNHAENAVMKAARMRSDSKAWEKAAESEMKSIADHDVLSRDFTLKELQEMGIYRSVGRGARSVYVDHYSGLHNKAPAPVRKCTSLEYYAPRIVGR